MNTDDGSRLPVSATPALGLMLSLLMGMLGCGTAAVPSETAGESGQPKLQPVLSASILDPWTEVCLSLGYDVYAERGEADGKSMLDGVYRAYAPGGVLVVEGAYSQGVPHGEFRYWDESGEPSGWRNYSMGKEVGTSLTLYESGLPMRLSHRDGDGRRDGLEAYWDPEGRLQVTVDWEAGHVQQVVRYEDGAPSETLTGEAAEKRATEMIREAMGKWRTPAAHQPDLRRRE